MLINFILNDLILFKLIFIDNFYIVKLSYVIVKSLLHQSEGGSIFC